MPTGFASLGVDDVLGGEFEEAADRGFARGARPASSGTEPRGFRQQPSNRPLPRLQFLVPDRAGLPAAGAIRDAAGGRRRAASTGYTEASRGCRHLCRHCPVVPVYTRPVPGRAARRRAGGCRGAGRGRRASTSPSAIPISSTARPTRCASSKRCTPRIRHVTYDVTIKVEHLLQHRDLVPRLRATGCLFVTSAVESLDDRTLAILDKGHTRQDVLDAVALCRDAGLTLVPTFVAFHPWQTLEGYCDLLRGDCSAGSRRARGAHSAGDPAAHPAGLAAARDRRGPPPAALVRSGDARRYRWAHADPRVDALHEEVAALVGSSLASVRRDVFDGSSRWRTRAPGLPASRVRRRSRGAAPAAVPFLSEPWYCCAEPNPEQLTL